MHGFRHAALLAVEIPPAGAIRHEVEPAVGRPRGLEDRFLGTAGDAHRRLRHAAGVQVREEEGRAVPRHVRVVPLQPRELRAVGAQHGIGIEVRAGGQHDTGGGRRGAERNRHECRRRLRVALRVVFADAEQALPGRVHSALRIEVAFGRERLRRLPGGEGVELLVGEVRGVDRALMHGVGSTAVFMHARADIEVARRDVHRRGARRGPHEHVAARFRRPAFEPVDVVAVHRNLPEAQRAGRRPRRRQRRRPRAIRRHRASRPRGRRISTAAASHHHAEHPHRRRVSHGRHGRDLTRHGRPPDP
jgi:hypothetical protein